MDYQTLLTELPLVGPSTEQKLNRLGIFSVGDLLFHAPHRYLDFSLAAKARYVRVGETVTIIGQIKSVKNIYSRTGRKMQIGQVEDETGTLTVVWFNQPFLVRSLYPGLPVSLAGKISWFAGKVALISPEYEIIKEGIKQLHTKGLVPVYPETAGLSSKWLRGRIQNALREVSIKEYLPAEIIREEKLIPLKEAVTFIHYPKNLSQAISAKKRLAFEELLSLHVSSLNRKRLWEEKNRTVPLTVDPKALKKFIESLPFKLTKDQNTAVKEILNDLTKKVPMNRLLEGDVGSGKTVVATISAFISFLNGCQTIVMAPTQILAQQHYETLNKFFSPYKIRVSLITSVYSKKEIGRTDIFVGTHALIQKKVGFEKVALIVIDEQHRFGVEQRAFLSKKARRARIIPHLLTMTATPIPRTVALTAYGDMDLSVLRELPAGRQRITTRAITKRKRKKAFDWLEKTIRKDKVQAFVVCPLIEESEKETMVTVKAVLKVYEELKSEFPKLKFGLLHGRLRPAEKNAVIDAFRKGKFNILVSTPVVEVGIDIPNATLMVIEAAERFGLASLHQLRGRVGRGSQKSYCLLMAEGQSEKVIARLKAMEEGLSGFELAELDLKLRGPGEIFGTLQSGFPELKIALWSDLDLIKRTKALAGKIIKDKKLFGRVLSGNPFMLAAKAQIV